MCYHHYKGCIYWRRMLKCEKEQITKVIDNYMVAVKKEGIIVGHLP